MLKEYGLLVCETTVSSSKRLNVGSLKLTYIIVRNAQLMVTMSCDTYFKGYVFKHSLNVIVLNKKKLLQIIFKPNLFLI